MPAQSFARVLAGRAKLFAWEDSREVFRSRAAHCFAPTQMIQGRANGGFAFEEGGPSAADVCLEVSDCAAASG
jgi:hypothetical protein